MKPRPWSLILVPGSFSQRDHRGVGRGFARVIPALHIALKFTFQDSCSRRKPSETGATFKSFVYPPLGFEQVRSRMTSRGLELLQATGCTLVVPACADVLNQN